LLSEVDQARRDRIQRAAVVGQLAGGIFHEFNNVLTVITGTIDLLAEAVAHEPQLSAMVKLIDEAATRGAAFTSNLLAFVRAQPSNPHEVDVNALLVEATRLLRPALGGIEIAVVAADDLPAALVDRGQLLAAVLSLAVAARNAMPKGGRLSFETAMVRTEGWPASSRRRTDGQVAIALLAYGYGDVVEHPEQIFTDAGMAQDFIRQAGGSLKICAPCRDRARVEILLPRIATAPWLADD
jgi:nitrogen-specific signal transduction histidine kinase